MAGRAGPHQRNATDTTDSSLHTGLLAHDATMRPVDTVLAADELLALQGSHSAILIAVPGDVKGAVS